MDKISPVKSGGDKKKGETSEDTSTWAILDISNKEEKVSAGLITENNVDSDSDGFSIISETGWDYKDDADNEFLARGGSPSFVKEIKDQVKKSVGTKDTLKYPAEEPVSKPLSEPKNGPKKSLNAEKVIQFLANGSPDGLGINLYQEVQRAPQDSSLNEPLVSSDEDLVLLADPGQVLESDMAEIEPQPVEQPPIPILSTAEEDEGNNNFRPEKYNKDSIVRKPRSRPSYRASTLCAFMVIVVSIALKHFALTELNSEPDPDFNLQNAGNLKHRSAPDLNDFASTVSENHDHSVPKRIFNLRANRDSKVRRVRYVNSYAKMLRELKVQQDNLNKREALLIMKELELQRRADDLKDKDEKKKKKKDLKLIEFKPRPLPAELETPDLDEIKKEEEDTSLEDKLKSDLNEFEYQVEEPKLEPKEKEPDYKHKNRTDWRNNDKFDKKKRNKRDNETKFEHKKQKTSSYKQRKTKTNDDRKPRNKDFEKKKDKHDKHFEEVYKCVKVSKDDKKGVFKDCKRHNVTGLWYADLHKARKNMREKSSASDWIFDRARLRSLKRDKAHWYFHWMVHRSKHRMQ